MHATRHALAAIVLAAGLGVCGKPDTRPGTLVGDAYIVTEGGQEVSLAALPVALIPDTPQIDTALAAVCPRAASPAQGPDSAAQGQAWRQRNQVLSARARQSATTDAAAHFSIAGVAPGKYRVWADTSYGGARWTWLAPVTVKPADTTKVALSNANPDDNPFRCKE